MNSELLNELAAAGCGVEASLNGTFMGNEAFYLKMLGKLPEKTILEKLRAALTTGEVKAVFEASHELKGVYAKLGLTPLFTACCEIVEIARAGSIEGIEPKLTALEAAHAEMMAKIQSGLGR